LLYGDTIVVNGPTKLHAGEDSSMTDGLTSDRITSMQTTTTKLNIRLLRE